MAAPTVSAAQAVAEYLQSPDDLAKVSAFRKKLEKEKASIDSRLKTGVREQLEATREGLRKLLGTRVAVQAIKDEMASVDRLCVDPQTHVKTFDQISRVSMVHRNFEQTQEMVDNLLLMNDRLDQLEDMLDADRNDITGPAPNLLAIHYQINQLEQFRNQTMHQAKQASAQSRGKLTQLFDRLNILISAFDEYVIALAGNILPIVRAGNTQVVVKLMKIAEVEGKEDEKAMAIRLVKKAAKMDAASRFKSLQANARHIKLYRSKMRTAIVDSIKQRFEDAYTQDENNPNAFLERLEKWLFGDIIDIDEEITHCFPQDWEVYQLYLKEYHKSLNDTLQKMLASDPEASVLLATHAWLKKYKKTMKELDVPPELLDPPLLDGKEQSLIDDYLKLIIQKLNEWTANLMRTELANFTQREEPPEVDADGMYGTQGAVILFQMVNQQADLATESGQGAILARVVADVSRAMKDIQVTWTRTVDAEFRKQVEKPEEASGGLVEYLIALANDQVKSADYTEALSSRLEPLVSEKYRVTIEERMNEAIEGFLDVANKCTSTLVEVVYNDLKPATKQLFQPPWYDGIMVQIVETMRDYTGDYQAYLNPSLLETLVDDMLEIFLVTYITALANASKLRMPAATDRMKEDISAVFSFLTSVKPAADVERQFEVLELILAMLEASKSLVFLSYWQFAKVHGPNLAFVESLMRAREDLDKSAVSEVMDSIKRKVKDEGLTEPEQPTIMRKITVQGGVFSRFLRNVAA